MGDTGKMQLNDNITIQKGDCCELIKKLPDGSVDAIITDPPYLYLKNQKLDKPFDEEAFFSEAKRVLKRRGFVVMFGRGTAFYRWNTRLADLGFTFKEEVIWNKRLVSNMFSSLNRVHETISIYALNDGSINKVRIEYMEKRIDNMPLLVDNIKRIARLINKPFGLEKILNYLENEETGIDNNVKNKYKIVGEKKYNVNRTCHVIKTIKDGLRESDIISLTSNHYTMQHPTQKPVRLMERLMALVTQEGDLVLDPFMGSGSTGIACINTGRRFIGYEIDDEYFGIAKRRLDEAEKEKSKELFFGGFYE